jgi:hypothetical protein
LITSWDFVGEIVLPSQVVVATILATFAAEVLLTSYYILHIGAYTYYLSYIEL